MIRKTLLSILFTITAIAVNAQLTVGSWRNIPSFSEVSQILDTPGIVYYVSSGQLYSYDKAADETYSFTSSSRLNGSEIKRIYHDAEHSLLAIVYSDASIDLLDKQGKVRFMADIRDAEINVVPDVNDIAFEGNKMYVATNFGIVVFDIDRAEIFTAGNYNRNMTHVSTGAGQVWLVESFIFYSAPIDTKLNSFTRFEDRFGYVCQGIGKLNDNQNLFLADEKYIVLMNSDKKEYNDLINIIKTTSNLRDLQVIPGTGAICRDNTSLHFINADGAVTSKTIPSNMRSFLFSTCTGLDKVWVGSKDGVALWDFSGTSPQLIKDAGKPMDVIGMQAVGRLHTAADGTVYASPYGIYQIRPHVGAYTNMLHPVYTISPDGQYTNVTPNIKTIANSHNTSKIGQPELFKDGADLKEWPGHPGYYVIGTTWDGIYFLDPDGNEVAHYHENNSTMRPIANGYCNRALAFDFDRKGNLWVGNDAEEFGVPLLHCLTADKVGKETASSDWQTYETTYNTWVETKVLASKVHDMVFYCSAKWEGPLLAVKTKGTPSVDDDELYIINQFVDQDGKTFSYYYLMHLLEDEDGHLWVGTDNGIFEITDPTKIDSSTARVNHLKVPRNDGTNFADYLLDAQMITWMALDPVGNKWIATSASGLYLVNDAGNEILEHHDTDNSPLPTNTILSVTCGPDNKVYVGTAFGLMVYNSLVSPASDDYSGMYAFPNPVRPGYQGWITVAGLMDNSLVKITDAAGHVLFQGKSQGGTFTWDGNDAQGRRVPTGVYYAVASASGDNTGAGVTKILVVN